MKMRFKVGDRVILKRYGPGGYGRGCGELPLGFTGKVTGKDNDAEGYYINYTEYLYGDDELELADNIFQTIIERFKL